MNLLIAFCIAWASVAAPIPQIVTLERFKQFPMTTLKQHRETLEREELADSKHLIYRDPRALGWAFDLRFEGKIQPIAGHRKELVGFVAKKNPQLAGRYVYEILVSDGTEAFWLPVQNDVLGYLKRDTAKKGDRLIAHTRFFGTYHEGVAKQFFIMLGYRKPFSGF